MTRKFPGGRRSRTPSVDRTAPLDAVTRLVEERGKYEQWLDELEEKKDSTPPKVFDRVRQDYLTRLQAVVDQLREHTATLQEHAANLVAKLRELEANEQEITDELAETELRANVGEITDAEWEATKRKAQREVAKLKEQQETVADDLIRIRDVLSDEPVEEEEEEAPRTSADFDELEFLKSVVGTSGGTPVSTPKITESSRPPKPETPTSTAAQRSTPSGNTATRRTPSGGAAPQPRATPTGGAAAPPRATQTGAPAAATPSPAPAPTAPPAEKKKLTPDKPDNALGLRSSDVPEQPKTLKCAECGTMNYSTEWYCERCGAELAQI
jgi:hypothetical protein